jgi:hypothetical protein
MSNKAPVSLPDLPIEIRISILGNLGVSDLRAALLSGHAFHEAFQESPQVVLQRAVFSDISPAAHGDAIAFLLASSVHCEYV